MQDRGPPDRIVAGRRRERRLAALVAGAFLWLVPLSLSLPSWAEDGREEVLIGTFDLKSRPMPPPGAVQQGEAEESPAGIYGAALGQLKSGDRQGAQRLLEVLVANHPSAPEARMARLRLGQMYGDLRAGPREPEPPQPATAEADASPRPDNDEGWAAEVRARRGGFEELFRMEVGDRVFFSSGSAELGSRARLVLAAQAAWLQRQPQADALIEGHADDPGSVEDNGTLARARAEAVRKRLIEEGVTADRLRISVLGRSYRVADCDGSECAAQNRRSVTVVFPHGSSPPVVQGDDQGDERSRLERSAETLDGSGPRRARR